MFYANNGLTLGWPDKPVARRVISLTLAYYIIAQRWKCSKSPRNGSNGCGKNFNMYDERILEQLPWQFQQTFPGMLYNHPSQRHRADILLTAPFQQHF